MAVHASPFGPGHPGGVIEYRGDVPAPDTTYAAAISASPFGGRLRVPASRASVTTTPVVSRLNRMRGIIAHVLDGAVRMPPATIVGPGYGKTRGSVYQPFDVHRSTWIENRGLHQAGYPRNLGLTFRGPQRLDTASGAGGDSVMQPRPLWRGVQQIGRARASVITYPTQGAQS